MLHLFEGKVALVTGASRGIGSAVAKHLAKAGALVIGTATTPEGATRIERSLAGLGAKKTGFGRVFNLQDRDALASLMTELQERALSPDILVNNAGITKDTLFLRAKEEDWEKVISTNLTALFSLTKACIKGMIKKRWGRIVNISSVVALTGNLGQTNYAAAKAGMIGFSKSLAREVASRGITVNCVAPGFIDTDMTHALQDKQRATLLEQIPLRRFGTAEDIALAVGFLVSDAAAYITGETVHVNGGMYMN